MNRKIKSSLIRFIGIGLIISLFLAIIWTIIAIGQDYAAHQEVVSWGSIFFISAVLMAASTGFFYSHILIHEAGHLIAGVVSGYTFLLFRMGRFGLIKEDKAFKLISYRMSGTLGQCLMYPPDAVIKPYRLYLAGGVLGNLLTATAGLGAYFLFPTRYLILFSLMGLVAAVTNGIPLGYNDGKILGKLMKSETAQEQFFQQLKWNGEFIRFEKTYSEVGTEDKIINVNQPITEQFNIYTKLVEINALLEQLKLDEAYSELSDLFSQRNYVITPYRVEIMREYLFCLLILNEGSSFLVEQIVNDPAFKEHLRTRQVDVFRLKGVLAYFRENDRQEAEIQLELAEDYLKKAPTNADRKVNRVLLDYLKELMEFE